MYASLNETWAVFWQIFGKTQILAKALKLVLGSRKLPSMKFLGELGSILLRFSRFSEVPPIQNEKIITLFTRVSNLSASHR